MKIDLITMQIVGCPLCIHKTGDKCKAFPNGIPLPFASGDLLHEKPVDGDGGIIFTPPKGAIIVKINQ